LTQKLTEEGGNKAEIEKYKDYLKKQNVIDWWFVGGAR
jgi:hypothetical protein